MLTALRLNVPLEQAGRALFANGERHLRSRLHLAQRYPPELLAETLKIAGLCQFSLDELRYEYPEEIVPPGQTPTAYLRAEVLRGLAVRYPDGTQDKTLSQVEYELSLIDLYRTNAKPGSGDAERANTEVNKLLSEIDQKTIELKKLVGELKEPIGLGVLSAIRNHSNSKIAAIPVIDHLYPTRAVVDFGEGVVRRDRTWR